MPPHCVRNGDPPPKIDTDLEWEVEMKQVASIEDLTGFLVDRLVEVDHEDTHLAKKLCPRKIFGNADSVAHHAVFPRDVEPPTGTDERIFVDLDSEFCR